MVKINDRLVCSTETKNLIINDCKEKFLKHNKDFKGMTLTQEFLLNRIALAYLDKL